MSSMGHEEDKYMNMTVAEYVACFLRDNDIQLDEVKE